MPKSSKNETKNCSRSQLNILLATQKHVSKNATSVWSCCAEIATHISQYLMHTLKVLDSWPLHELTNHPNWITEVRSSDCQINEASKNLSKPGLIVMSI